MFSRSDLNRPKDLEGAEGKRGDKQLITVFGDAPDENKEPEEAQTCEADERQLYFRAVGEPSGESSFPPLLFSLKK